MFKTVEDRVPVGCLRKHGLAGQQEAEQAGQGASQQAARPGGGVWVFMLVGLRHNQKNDIIVRLNHDFYN